MNATELLMRNFKEIFIELDPVKRGILLAECFTEDCLWIHPGGRIVGREDNVATCRWGSGMPGQPFHYTGTDFLEERDGRVSRLYTFIDQKLFSPERA